MWSNRQKSLFSATFRIWHGPCNEGGTAPQGGTDFWEEEMIDMSKLGQTLVSTVAAALLTVTAVGAAVGPARAVETAPVSLVAAPVSGQAQA
jgi:hypothetical protein